MRKIAIAFLSLTIAGCGLIDRIRGNDEEIEPLKPNPLPTITQEAALKRHWSYTVGGESQAGLRPALGATAVYVANTRGGVAAVDLQSGSAQWRRDLNISVSGGVGTGEGLVLVGGLDGEVVALDSRDGSEVWRSTVDSEVMAPPVADSGHVLVRTIDGGVMGLSTTSGEQRWNLRWDVPSLTLRGSGPPLIQQGVAVMGFADGKLAAIDINNGALLWEVTVARPSGTNEVERMIDVDATPILRGDTLYTVSFQGNVTASSLGADQLLWRKEISSYSDFTADRGNLYISDSTGRVYALDRTSGETIWLQEELLRRRLSGPTVAGPYVVVGDFEGYLHVIDKSDGRLVGRGDFGERISTQPLVRDERVLVMTDSGRLASVSITAGGS